MARYIEVTATDGTISRTRIDPSVNRFSVRPGDSFTGLDEAGQQAATSVELLDFYGVCSVANPCQVEVREAAGSAAPIVVTSSSEPIAALADGSFVLYDPARGSALGPEPTAAPTADDAGDGMSNTALVWGGVGIGVLALALAGGGGGGGSPSATAPSPASPPAAPPGTPPGTPSPSPTPAAPPAGPAPDTTPPSRPVIATISSDGRVTLAEKAAGLVITGTGEPGATVSVTIPGAAQTGAVDEAGNWQVQFAPAQIPPDGFYTAQATVTDAAGNRSAAATSQLEVRTFSTIFAVDTDGVVNAADRAAGFNVVGSGPEGSPAGTAVTVAMAAAGGAAVASRTVLTNAAGNWQATFTAADNLPDGNYTATATATINGVAGAPGTRNALVDATPPPAPVINPVTGDNIVTPIEAAGAVVTGRVEPGSSVVLSVGPGPTAITASVLADGTWSAPLPQPLAPGIRDVIAAAIDAAGNRGPSTQVLFTVTTIGMAGTDDPGNSILGTAPLQLEQLLSDVAPATSVTTAPSATTSVIGGIDALSTVGALIDDPNRGSLA
jgi:hypothetical protein